MLITFDGIDGAGKTTQTTNLVNFLRTKLPNVVATKEPNWGPGVPGIMTHLILSDETTPTQKLFLLLANRADHQAKMVRPILQGGYGVPAKSVIVSDGGPDSSLAYQSYGEGLANPEFIAEANRVSMQGHLPQLTFILDLDIDLAMTRSVDKSFMVARGPEFMQRVRAGYQEIAKVERNRVVLLDASKPVEEVFRLIQAEVTARMAL